MPGQYYDTETITHYNYFRDYDPAIGRYVQSDPILQPIPAIGVRSWIATAIVLQWPSVLASYDYGFSNPLLFADDHGLFSLLDFIKCLYYGNELKDFRAACERECPPDNEGYIRGVQQYGGAGYDDAVRACMCKKAGPERCKNFIESCVKTPYWGKPPTIPWLRVPR